MQVAVNRPRLAGHAYTAQMRRALLGSGLVLFIYATTHLANHALGLISLEAMELGRVWFLWVWRSLIGAVALYGALSLHVVLTLVALYRRRHFRMPMWEALQVGLGLLILPFLMPHIVGTRLAHLWFGTLDSLYPDDPDLLGDSTRPLEAPIAPVDHRLASRLYRAPFLASTAVVVPSRGPLLVRACGAVAGSRLVGFHPSRTGGVETGARTRLAPANAGGGLRLHLSLKSPLWSVCRAFCSWA